MESGTTAGTATAVPNLHLPAQTFPKAHHTPGTQKIEGPEPPLTHYLPLVEQKINALDQAAPLAEWDLPPEFATLRWLMEARMVKAGRREYVQVLRLLERFGINELHAAMKKALQLATRPPLGRAVAKAEPRAEGRAGTDGPRGS